MRGLDRAALGEALTAVIDALQDAADARRCDLDLDVAADVQRLPAEAASSRRCGSPRGRCSAIGYEPALIASGGGSDANAFRAAGPAVICLANGTERNHEPGERVSAEALEGGLDLAIALLATAPPTIGGEDEMTRRNERL